MIVIGGGDTGSDCVGTAIRQGALSVTNFELLPAPPPDRPADQPWPFWPNRPRTSSSHEEGGRRYWSLLTQKFEGEYGRLNRVVTVDVAFGDKFSKGGRMRPLPETRREWRADLVLLALGFLGPETGPFAGELGIDLDGRGNFRTDGANMTNVPGIFAAGDARRGQSLIVWAISEGRETASHVDRYLTGRSQLPTKGPGDLPRL